MKKKYKFSVVMAIYNVERYLEDAILSVVKQDIGFEDNVQLILVNDGSPDNSESICLKYKNLYPDNIVYLKKKNGGVSSARNLGLQHAEGDIVNFLDSDDFFSKNAFKEVLKCFSKYKVTDVVSINLVNFEASSGSWVNKKFFNENRLINMLDEPNFMQCQVGASFIKIDAAKKYLFSEKVKIHEDTHYIYRIFFDNPYCATVGNATYWHRIRYKNNSATQTINYKKNIDDLTNKVFLDLIKFYKSKYDYIPDYLQNLIILEYNYYCIKKISDCSFDSEEVDKLKKWINLILNEIDVLCIKDHFVISDEDKRIMFLLKDNIENIYILFPSLLHVNLFDKINLYIKRFKLIKKAY